MIEGDTGPFPEMPKEGTELDYDKAGEKKMAAADAKGNGDYAKAMEFYTEVFQ